MASSVDGFRFSEVVRVTAFFPNRISIQHHRALCFLLHQQKG